MLLYPPIFAHIVIHYERTQSGLQKKEISEPHKH